MLRRKLASGVLLLGLLGLVAAGFSMMKIHLFADFDVHEESGGGIKIEIGTLVPIAGAAVFDVDFPQPNNGVLVVGENNTGAPARLRGELTSPVTSAAAYVSFRLTPIENYGDLVVSLAEDGESGMIDITFDPDGRVRVGNESRPLPGLPGDDIHVRLELRDSLFGHKTFVLTLEGPLGFEELNGSLGTDHGALEVIEFMRLGGSSGAIWHLDELLVTSSVPKPFSLFGYVLDLSQ